LTKNKNKKLYQLHQVLRNSDITFQSQIGIRLQAQQKQHLLGNKKFPQDNTSSALRMAKQNIGLELKQTLGTYQLHLHKNNNSINYFSV